MSTYTTNEEGIGQPVPDLEPDRSSEDRYIEIVSKHLFSDEGWATDQQNALTTVNNACLRIAKYQAKIEREQRDITAARSEYIAARGSAVDFEFMLGHDVVKYGVKA